MSVAQEHSEALGMGFRCGYLGVLHMNIFQERLFKEFGMPVLVTAPFVPHRAVLKKDHEEVMVRKPSEMPPPSELEQVLQPMTHVTILTPKETVSALMKLCRDRRGEELAVQYLDNKLVLMEYLLPWSEVVTDFYDTVKNVSSGYASIEYEEGGWEEDDVVKVDILINGKPVDALAFVCNRRQVETRGRGNPPSAEGGDRATTVRGDSPSGGGVQDSGEGAHSAISEGRSGEGRQACRRR